MIILLIIELHAYNVTVFEVSTVFSTHHLRTTLLDYPTSNFCYFRYLNFWITHTGLKSAPKHSFLLFFTNFISVQKCVPWLWVYPGSWRNSYERERKCIMQSMKYNGADILTAEEVSTVRSPDTWTTYHHPQQPVLIQWSISLHELHYFMALPRAAVSFIWLTAPIQ